MGEWAVALNGVKLISCEDDSPAGCDVGDLTVVEGLTDTPDGLGLPGLRTEDVTFFQRDGVKHFNDWYEPRQVTLTATIGPAPACTCSSADESLGYSGQLCSCLSVREQVMALIQAWKRTCCDTELVVYPPCDPAPPDPNNPVLDPDTVEVRTNMAFNPRGIVSGYTGEYLSRFSWVGSYRTGQFDLPTELDALGVETYNRQTNSGADTTVTGRGVDLYGDAGAASPGLSGDWIKQPVASGQTYTLSMWVRSSVAVADATITVRFHDGTGNWSAAATSSTPVALAANTWVRLSFTVTAPITTGDLFMVAGTRLPSATAVTFPDGATVDTAGLLIEQTGTLGDWFDGSVAGGDDPDPPAVGGTHTEYGWVGTVNDSPSDETTATYVAGPAPADVRALTGPYGIVGRPRVAQYRWLSRSEQIADVLLRFDAVDHRAYVLDECGTPGYQQCIDVTPGTESLGVCWDENGQLCFGAAGICFTTVMPGSIPAGLGNILVGGTETVFPQITLYPSLSNPRIVNLNTGDSITYTGTVVDYPVTIDTYNGTAFDSNGDSQTHRLGGNIFMSLEPGNHQLRLFQTGDYGTEVGYATMCWRDTVVAI